MQTSVGSSQNFYEVPSLQVHGGYFNDRASYGLRMGNQFNSSSAATNAFTGSQDGGLVFVANEFSLGGNSGTYAASYALSSGTLSTTTNISLGANATGGGQTTFALSGGKLLTNSTIAGAQGTGAKQAFVWTGGVLAANAYNATNLTSSAGVAVGASTNTLTNNGGTLAPGDLGVTGRTTITGNYTVNSGALAIDLGGTTSSSSFQDATGSGSYDNLSITGTVALGGSLSVALVTGTGGGQFVPTSGNTFNILTGAAALSGSFSNTIAKSASTSRIFIAGDDLNTFLVTVDTSAKVVKLGSYAVNEWQAAGGNDWGLNDNWTAAAPGSGSYSGYLAQFGSAGSASVAGVVNVNAPQSVRGLIFSNTNAYTLSGAGTLTLQGAGPNPATIAVNAGSHTISSAVTLASNLVISASTGAALTLPAITAPGNTVTNSGSGTLRVGGTWDLGGLTVNGGTLDLNGNGASVGVLSGSSGTAITSSVAGAASLTTTIASGTSTYAGSISDGAGSVTLTKQGAGKLILSGSLNMAGLNANNGVAELTQSGSIGAISVSGSGAVTVTAHGGGAYKVIDTSSLTITSGGSMDLWNNAMILRASGTSQNATNLATVQAQVNSAKNGLLWNGVGLGSTTAYNEAQPPLGTQALALMVYDNSVINQSSFEGVSGLGYFDGGGQPVGYNQVLVKLTYLGDFNADGVINASDYTWLDGFALSGNVLGDLNGDGFVNATDYTWLDGSALNQGFGVLAAQQGSRNGSPETAATGTISTSPEAVPEPGTLGLLLTSALGLLGFRRQRKN